MKTVNIVDDNWNAVDCIKEKVKNEDNDDPFYIFDTGNLISRFNLWREKIPRVHPYYAVKCNDKMIVCEVLASLGCNFDCASKNEINKILSICGDPKRILFANTSKPKSHILRAKEANVDLTVFDNECELLKIKELYPNARLLMRIKYDSNSTIRNFGDKFGCDVKTEAPYLLKKAKELQLNVVGLSFHIGSEVTEKGVFQKMIERSFEMFTLGLSMGFNMNLLDIGGGYPGDDDAAFYKIADEINELLNQYFPISSGVKIISEPGRFFATSPFTLAFQVFSKTNVYDNIGFLSSIKYTANVGIYTSFNGIVYKILETMPIECVTDEKAEETIESSIWGPTCDSNDCITRSIQLPKLKVYDWLMMKRHGSYNLSISSGFNGFSVPLVYTYITNETWKTYKEVANALKKNYKIIQE